MFSNALFTQEKWSRVDKAWLKELRVNEKASSLHALDFSNFNLCLRFQSWDLKLYMVYNFEGGLDGYPREVLSQNINLSLGLWRAWAPQTNECPIIVLFVMMCLLFKTTFPLASHFWDSHFTLGHFELPERELWMKSLESTLNSWTRNLISCSTYGTKGASSWELELRSQTCKVREFNIAIWQAFI